jgi:hypothetical protein
MKQTERAFYYYDLILKGHVKRRGVMPPKSAKFMFDRVRKIISKEKVIATSKDGLRSFKISQINSHDESDAIVLLISKWDTAAPSTSYFSTTGGRRRAPKDTSKNEGLEESCHVAINLNPNDDDDDSYVMIFEKVGSITIIEVKSIINALMRKVSEVFDADMTIQDPSTPKKMLKLFCLCDIQGHISEDLEKDINSGKISEIELFKKEKTTFDTKGKLEQIKESIFLTPTIQTNNMFQEILSAIKGTQKAKSMENAKIRFKPGDAANTRSVTLKLDKIDAYNTLYVKKIVIDTLVSRKFTAYSAISTSIQTIILTALRQ